MTDHVVVLQNGRDDVVCSCGEHFRKRVIDASVSYEKTDAITQWAGHYRRELGTPEGPADVLAVADVLARWGVRSQHGEWSDRETQVNAARDVLRVLER